MGSMFNSTAAKVTGLPGIGGKGSSEPAKPTGPLPVPLKKKTAEEQQRKAGQAATIFDTPLGGAGGDSL